LATRGDRQAADRADKDRSKASKSIIANNPRLRPEPAIITQPSQPDLAAPEASSSSTVAPSNVGVDSLIVRHQRCSKVKGVKLTSSSILTFLREEQYIPSQFANSSAASITRKTKQLFLRVSYQSRSGGTRPTSSRNLGPQPATTPRPESTHGGRTTPVDIGRFADAPTHAKPPAMANSLLLPSRPLRRLIIEDIILLPPSDETFVLCVSPSAPGYATCFLDMHDSHCPSPPYHVRDVRFLQFRVAVIRNIRRDSLLGGLMDRPTLQHLLLQNGNEAIGLSFLDAPSLDPIYVKWQDFFVGCATLQLWGSLPSTRSWRDALKNKTSIESRLRLLQRLSFELEGDVSSTFELVNAYNTLARVSSLTPSVEDSNLLSTIPFPSSRASHGILDQSTVAVAVDHVAVSAGTSLVAAAFLSDLDSAVFDMPSIMAIASTVTTPAIDLSGPSLKVLDLLLRDIMKARMQPCFGGFVSWSDPILLPSDLELLCNAMFLYLTKPANDIAILLGYATRKNYSRSSYLASTFYDRMTLFQLLSLARTRHDHNFLLWSCIGAAVAYGCSARAVTQRMGIYFGHACTDETLLKATLPICSSDLYFAGVDCAMDKVGKIEVLFEGDSHASNFLVCIGMFDNSQRNQKFKFQRGASSGKFVRLTSRAYLQPWQGSWKSLPFPRSLEVDITYIDQAIPSPAGMLAYERFLVPSFGFNLSRFIRMVDDECLAIAPDASSPPRFDASGTRVIGFMKVLRAATILRCIHRHMSVNRRYVFEPEAYYTSTNQIRLQPLLNTRRQRTGMLHMAGSFLRRSVVSMRGLRPKAQLNCLPCLSDDEVTNEGMQHVATKMCLRGRLLVSNPNPMPGAPAFVVANNIASAWNINIGDGLSHERWHTAQRDLLDLQAGMGYTQHYEQCRHILQALSKVLLGAGDLHLCLSIYSVQCIARRGVVSCR